MRFVPLLASALLLTALAPKDEARAASVTAWAWSYETSETRIEPSLAIAEIARQAAGAPGDSHAGASSVFGVLSSYSQIRGCGSQFNSFQQVCNDARSGSSTADTLTVTAALPPGAPVQVRVTLTLRGEVNGHGGYSYSSTAGLGSQSRSISGGSAGTVQIVDHLSIDHTEVFDVTLQVGAAHPLMHTLSTIALQRFCAGGSQDCYDSEHLWSIVTGATSSVRVEVLTAGVNAHVHAASGHDYSLATAAAPGEVLTATRLGPAWPNPGRGRVQLALTLAEASDVDAAVFDIAGRRVASLARGAREPGTHTLAWDGRDADGREVRGVFFVRVRGPRFDLVRRVLMTRG